MDKIKRFESILDNYLRYSQLNYFVEAYIRVYNYLHNHKGLEVEYNIDYGRLWGMYEFLQYEMSDEETEELLDLIVRV